MAAGLGGSSSRVQAHRPLTCCLIDLSARTSSENNSREPNCARERIPRSWESPKLPILSCCLPPVESPSPDGDEGALPVKVTTTRIRNVVSLSHVSFDDSPLSCVDWLGISKRSPSCALGWAGPSLRRRRCLGCSRGPLTKRHEATTELLSKPTVLKEQFYRLADGLSERR